MSDNALIKRIKGGDRESFKVLVDTYKEMVYTICYNFVKNKEDAEDIAQDVFITMYKNIKNFKFASKISTWTYRIAVNRSLNHIRGRKIAGMFTERDFVHENNNADVEIPAPESSSADRRMITDEQKKIIFMALNGLPDNQRAAFTLHNIEEFTYQEIAEIMECSVSAVESRIHRAKMSLQKKLVANLKEFL